MSSAPYPASGRAMRQPSVRTARLPRVTRRAEAGPDNVATTGGIAPPRLAPSTSTMTSSAETHAGRGERQDEHHHRKARRGREGKCCRDDHRHGQGVVQQADEGGECGRSAHRFRRKAKEVQRQQHQPDADQRCAAALAGAGTAAVEHDAGKNQERREPFDARCDDPGGDRGADIGAEQDDLRHARLDQVTLDEGGGHQRRRCGALQRDRCDEA